MVGSCCCSTFSVNAKMFFPIKDNSPGFFRSNRSQVNMKRRQQPLAQLFWAFVCLMAPVTAIAAQEKRMEFTLAQAPWTMTMPADNFRLAQRQTKPDGTGAYFYLTDETQHLNLSMFIEPANDCKDSKSCRDMVWKAGNPAWVNPQNVVQSEIGDVSFFEFLIPSFQGMAVQQQNMYAEFVVDGFWVDLHISKVLYQPEEHKLFERLIKSIKFEPKKARPPV